LLPPGVSLSKVPSIYLERSEVEATLSGALSPQQTETIRNPFEAETGFRLIVKESKGTPPPKSLFGPDGRMEINAAYRRIDEAFASQPHAPYKKGKKLDSSGAPYIELSFLTPQVGRRYEALLKTLEEEIRWPIRVSDQPNQIALSALVKEMLPPGLTLLKEPSINRLSGEIQLKLAAPPDPALWEAFAAAFEEETGYRVKKD
jgi:hypothetical protein